MINQIVDSQLSTPLLESMYATNEAVIKNLKAHGLEAKNLIGWRNKLNLAISIRKALNAGN